MAVGIGFLVLKLIIGGVIGDFAGLAGMLFSLIALIMIIIQTFKKDVTGKSKLIGWGLIILWVIVISITGASKS
jgi:FtsH-binding integral membrane protein